MDDETYRIQHEHVQPDDVCEAHWDRPATCYLVGGGEGVLTFEECARAWERTAGLG
jgi:hypothetical protein